MFGGSLCKPRRIWRSSFPSVRGSTTSKTTGRFAALYLSGFAPSPSVRREVKQHGLSDRSVFENFPPSMSATPLGSWLTVDRCVSELNGCASFKSRR